MYITNKSIAIKPSLDLPVKMRPVSIPIFIERQWEPVKVNIPPPQPLDGATYTSWRDRKKKIDDALSWLRTELSNLKIQDQQILGQLRRCQDTIENLKLQKNTWHDGDMSEDDLEEDEGHWEDWEISEFDRAFDKSINECKDLEKQCLDLETDFETRRKTPSVSSSLSSPNSDKHSKYFHKYSESESSSGSSSYIRQDIEDADRLRPFQDSGRLRPFQESDRLRPFQESDRLRPFQESDRLRPFQRFHRENFLPNIFTSSLMTTLRDFT